MQATRVLRQRGQTLVEKIVQKHVVGSRALARSGDIVTVRPRYVMTHDNTAAVMNKYEE